MEYLEIEKSIIKKYRKTIWSRFIRGIKEYELVKDNDKIAVCISGGKDSFLLAKCFEELKRHGQIKFGLEFIVMNPGYNEDNLELLKNNLNKLNIKAHIFNTNIFDVVEKNNRDSFCYLCARMRRGFLYNKAKELGCNKIALGHHFDDVIETILLNIFYAGSYKTMMPKLKSDNYEGIELIRPLYYVKEEDIIAWSKSNELKFLDCACKMTTSKEDGKRKEIKQLIKNLRNVYENIDINIMRSSENVNLDAVIGYKTRNKKTSFLDDYEENN
ncbi:MAG: ATP-binding protein [Bacilli bacterium]